MKNFQEFIYSATRKYKISFKEADQFIRSRLRYLCLTPRTVICFINWCDNDHLIQAQIAKKLNISQETVSFELMKLRKVWPHLFGNAQTSIPDLLEMRVLSKKNEHEVVRKF